MHFVGLAVVIPIDFGAVSTSVQIDTTGVVGVTVAVITAAIVAAAVIVIAIIAGVGNAGLRRGTDPLCAAAAVLIGALGG